MKKRTAITVTAATIALLATAAGCSSPTSTPAKPSATPIATPSIPAATVARYLHDLRDPADGAGGDDQRLAAGHTPDSDLIAAGAVVCAASHRGDFYPVALLKQKGWDDMDAGDIILATASSRLCNALGLRPAPSPVPTASS